MNEPSRTSPEEPPERGDGPQLIADFSESLPMALLRAREAVMARVRPMLRSHGVTEQQWRVLRILNRTAPMEAAQLARQVFLLRPSLSRILRDLQARGLVGRTGSGASLRRSLLHITDAGRALIAEASADAISTQAEIERVYGVEALAELKGALGALERSLTRTRR